MKDFYLDLYSNNSLDIHSTNTCSNFKNSFQGGLYLPPFSEIGLAEVSWVNSFENVSYEKMKIQIFDHLATNDTDPVTYGTWSEDIIIPTGFYHDSKSFADEINRLINIAVPRLNGKDLLLYSQITQKYTMNITDDLFLTAFVYGKALYVLGATENENIPDIDYSRFGMSKMDSFYMFHGKKRVYFDQDNTWRSTQHGNNQFKFLSQVQVIDSFIIYLNAIEPVLTATGSYQIIRTCATSERPDRRVIEKFSLIHYYNSLQTFFETLHVRICDLWDREIKFLSGFVRLKLHIRQRSVYNNS